MNHTARRVARDLEKLGWTRTPNLDNNRGEAWTHPSDPAPILIGDRVTDGNASSLLRRARRAADPTAGRRNPANARARAAARRREEAEQRARETRARDGMKRITGPAQRRRATDNTREIRALMQPGHGR